MTNNISIISSFIYDIDKEDFTTGGVQTYVKSLALLFQKNNINTTIYQISKSDWQRSVNGIKIVGVKTNSNQKLFNKIYPTLPPNSVVIIATDALNIKSKQDNVITINHGICFDYPLKSTGLKFVIDIFEKILRCVRNCIRFNYVRNTVCVDYNYFNWLRTITSKRLNAKLRVIPNFCLDSISEEDLEQKLTNRKTEPKKIVFARRFVDYRGTKVFANVAKKLLSDFPETTITFAGAGPLEEYIRDFFKNDSRVNITRFASEKTIEFHKQFDIAIVPTIFSEGTSLSLLDAMGAGCFPVATHVGGMTNIILDNFNGFLCAPEENEIYETLRKVMLLENDEFQNKVRFALKTAKYAFGYDNWATKWLNVVRLMSSK